MASMLTVACGNETPKIHVSWPDAELVVGAVAVVQGGNFTRLEGPIGLEAGAVVYGPSAVEIDALDAEVYLLGLTPTQLGALSWTVDRAALPERAELLTELESCQPGRTSEDGETFRASLPLDASRFRLGPEASAFEEVSDLPEVLSGLGFVLPVDFDSCLPDRHMQPRAFGRQDRYFGDSMTLFGQALPDVSAESAQRLVRFREVHRLSEQWMIGMAEGVLYLLERDGVFEDLDRRRVASSVLPAIGGASGFWAFRGFAVDPTSPPGGPFRVLVAAARGRASQGIGGAIAELEIRGDEVRFVRTATAFDGVHFGLQDIIFESDGAFIAVGDGGLVLTGTSARSRSIDVFRVENFDRVTFQNIVSTERQSDRHFIGSGQGVLAVGNAWQGPLAFHQETPEAIVTETVDVVLRNTEDRQEVWAATYSDGFFSRDADGQWQRASLDVHRSAQACASNADACGRRNLSEALDHLLVSPSGSILVTSDFCSAIFEYSPERSCGESITIDGSSIRSTPGESFAGLHRLGPTVTVAGSSGRVYDLVWSE